MRKNPATATETGRLEITDVHLGESVPMEASGWILLMASTVVGSSFEVLLIKRCCSAHRGRKE